MPKRKIKVITKDIYFSKLIYLLFFEKSSLLRRSAMYKTDAEGMNVKITLILVSKLLSSFTGDHSLNSMLAGTQNMLIKSRCRRVNQQINRSPCFTVPMYSLSTLGHTGLISTFFLVKFFLGLN